MLTGLESLFVDSSLAPEVPSTIADLQISDDITYFFDRPDKLDDSLQQSSNGSPVEGLLNLDDIQESWRSPMTEISNPDWMPLSDEHVFAPLEEPSNSHTSRSHQSAQHPTSSPQRASKRSSTSESEILSEIVESSKRAKRCTANLSEEEKKHRRKELNRLAAQRCRSKRRGHAEVLEQEIDELTKKNKELKERLDELTSTKDELYDIIKFHFSSCHGQANVSIL